MNPPELQGFPAPKTISKPTLPPEEAEGCNKYTYFVCSSVGQPWIALPDVTPEQIVAAKSIRKYFTGDLNAPIISFPKFPGRESNLLRAQIARITSSTVVCPAGYYTFDPETADEENPSANTHIILNTEVEMLPNESMLSLENWVHQTPYILPQGRANYVSPPPPQKDQTQSETNEEEEEDETEDATKGDSDRDPEPETGPPLLTPITEDADFGDFPSWSVGFCSRLQKNAPVHLRSNRWPGSHAVYYNGKFASIYFGDGQKDTGGVPFALPKLPPLQSEFPGELNEEIDPGVEDEKAFENMLKEKEDDAKPDEDVGDDDNGEKE
ncbi:Radial spoke head protein 4 A [Coelomomyces lativittatus]|nr:Radial spoke head protein 4 A [Coelomomyces lativittatus]